ncbi:30S ribosomal protein S16 [Puniceicoccales bacterium CK1056]|uniref:Small ribosomal subunit protein bS16 n=1 Tax=Oceanipulchritudo coccoides TaxID=2706888 RepID=A0A6B2M382_9BACT|nr:30S ribosomal protein S16 [Oceanipulchritudo coccoides]NDV62772.1 30S ribosomal protein S16 [Oceanipulchritudo coccoides]
MAVKIRMQRGGATHNPHYRVVVTDSRSPRDGRFVEKVGTYDPKNKDASKHINLNLERIDYWVSVGAKPSDTVRSLIKKARKGAVEVEAPAVKAEAAPVAKAEAPAAEVAETVAAEAPAEKAAE